jgi:hypothetical protein
MTDTLGGTYTTGSISIAVDGTSVIGTGTLWNPVAEQGDWLFSVGHIAYVDSVVSDTELILAQPWTGGLLANEDYLLVKMSWLRYEPALTQQKIRELLAYFDDAGVFYFVEGEEPDPALGSDGQYALKTNDGPWKLWLKVAGEWILQGTPIGFNWEGLWSSGTEYLINDVVHRLGKSYIALRTTIGDAPETSPLDWDLFVIGGSRVEIMFNDTDQPTSGETLIKSVFTTATQFPIGMSESVSYADVQATASAVFSIRKNDVEFAILTFSPGSNSGVYASAAGATFAANDRLTVVAPNPRDTTLRGVSATMVASR